MKILLINHYAGGPHLGMEHRPWYMAREWNGAGHEARVVAAGFAHTRTTQPLVNKVFMEDEVSGVPYTWLKTPAYLGNTPGRVRNMLTFVTRLGFFARRISRLYKPDVVIASSTYPLDIWPARRIAKLSGAKLVFEVHDLWPLSPMVLGGYSPRHPYIRLLQRAEHFAYKHADKVVSLLPHTLEHMVQQGMSPDKFEYIPNGIFVDDWDAGTGLPDEHKKIIEELRHSGHLIIGYTGAHGVANAMEPLIEAAALVKDLPVSFLLVGSGPEKEQLKATVVDAGLKNVHFASNVPKNVLPVLLDRMDCLYIGFRKQPLYRFGVSPNKIFDYMMAGKPIIQAIEAGNNPVKEAGCGFAIEPDNPGAIAEAIRRVLATSPEELKNLGEAGKRYVIANHNYSILAEKFIASL